jgi:RNA polymerase sigma-70 factor, ECF subfamily
VSAEPIEYAWGEGDEGDARSPWASAEPDEALVARARAGGRDAFAALYLRYHPRVRASCRRFLGGARDGDNLADDLADEVFARAWVSLPRTTGPMHLNAWLHRIAHNCCLDHYRRSLRIRFMAWDSAQHDQLRHNHPSDDPERAALVRETRAAVRRVLDRMSPRNRRALVLREYEGLSCEEIGEAVGGLTASGAKSLLFRARDEFRRVWGATEARQDWSRVASAAEARRLFAAEEGA